MRQLLVSSISDMLPDEKVKRIIYQLIVKGELISVDETGYVCESVKLPEVRHSLQ